VGSYLKHSNVSVAIDLNPYQWRVHVAYSPPVGKGFDAHRSFFLLRVLFLRVMIVIDNGEAKELE